MHPVAVSGDPAPDRPGAVFDAFNGLSLNDAGDVAVVAQTAFNDGGIWKTTGGILGLVTDSSFNESIFLTDDARLVHANSSRIVIYDGGTATTIAEAGQPVSVRPDLSFTSMDRAAFNPDGSFLFKALVRRTTPPDDANPQTLFAYRNGVLELIGREGEPLTAVGPNYIYEPTSGDPFPPGTHDMAASGDVVYVALFQLPSANPNAPLDRGNGLFLRRGGTTVRLHMDGDYVPGLMHMERFAMFKQAWLDNSRQVTFGAILSGPGVDETDRLAWFTEIDGGLELLLRTGEPAPGLPAGHVYRALRDVHHTPGGLAFISVTNDVPDPQLGTQRIWNGPPDDLAQIVSADWLADPPGNEGDTATVVRLSGNAIGRFVYQTADVIGDALPESLYMAGQGVDRRIVGVGDDLGGRTVAALLQHQLNESAEVALHVRFDDGGDGVFLFAMLGDFDRDADVDMPDFMDFAACYAGMNRGPGAGCPPNVDADFDDDGDVDLADYARFAQSFTGSR
jgi:hypothetical protein